jgi:DNA ligase 1
MKKFADLYIEFAQESRFQRRVDSLAIYFQQVSEEDAAIAISFFLGCKNKTIVKKEVLARAACETANIPSWMFEECLTQGNDFLDTVSMIIPRTSIVKFVSLEESLLWLDSLRKLDENECKQAVVDHWRKIGLEERIVINQMLCGVFKFGVSFDELATSLALFLRIDKGIIGTRLSKWKSKVSSLKDLRIPIDELEVLSLPETLEQRWDWTNELKEKLIPRTCRAKWVFDGIDVQVVRSSGKIFIWGAEKRLFRSRFPEIESYFLSLDIDLLLHGTLVGRSNDGIDKVILQKRESKKIIAPKIIDDFPVRLIVSEVRKRNVNSQEIERVNGEALELFLQKINNSDSLFIWNEEIEFNTWEELFLAQTKQKLRGSLGLEIIQSQNIKVGIDQRKCYFKRNEPHSLNLILLYVRLGLYNGDKSGEEYTFGIRHESAYLPITRVSALHDDNERTFIKEFVKLNTLEKFGPVRNVKPVLVFKISFASIYLNERKKSGVELVNSNIVCRLAHVTVDDAHLMQDVLNFL